MVIPAPDILSFSYKWYQEFLSRRVFLRMLDHFEEGFGNSCFKEEKTYQAFSKMDTINLLIFR